MSDEAHDKEHKQHAGHGGGHGGAHGGGHEGEHEGAPEWLISFADNTALIMGFFVIMLAMNMKPAGAAAGSSGGKSEGEGPSPHMLDMVLAIRAAFNNPINPSSNDPSEMPFVARLLARNNETDPQEPGPRGKDHDVQSLRPSKYHGTCGSVPFLHGSSALEPDVFETINDVARRVRGLRFIVEVRGHVSSAEAAGGDDNGMRLSNERALAVARALTAQGVHWNKLRVIACADNERINPRAYNNAGQRPNERVEIVVTDQVLPDYVQADAATTQSAAPRVNDETPLQ